MREIKKELPKNLNYAETDLSYPNVDILLRVEYYEYFLENERIFHENLTLRNTKFGYIISGTWKTSILTNRRYTGLTRVEIDDQLCKVCKIEEITENNYSAKAEELSEIRHIEEKFEKTVTRNEEGHLIVDLLAQPSIIN